MDAAARLNHRLGIRPQRGAYKGMQRGFFHAEILFRRRAARIVKHLLHQSFHGGKLIVYAQGDGALIVFHHQPGRRNGRFDFMHPGIQILAVFPAFPLHVGKPVIDVPVGTPQNLQEDLAIQKMRAWGHLAEQRFLIQAVKQLQQTAIIPAPARIVPQKRRAASRQQQRRGEGDEDAGRFNQPQKRAYGQQRQQKERK